MTNYVAKARAARLVQASGTTLYHVAAQYLGDATQWYRIAQINGLLDPWISTVRQLRIPDPLPSGQTGNGGILGQ